MKAKNTQDYPIEVLIVAIPETAGSALYGMLDVLSATGSIWQTLLRSDDTRQYFRVRIVSPDGRLFSCGNGIPVNPDCAVGDDPSASIVILPELWLGPDQTLHGCYPELIDWLQRRHRQGAHLYSACSGAILLAETGLLDGCPATSHWGYQDLFNRRFPKVRFDPAPNLVYADPGGRIVTAGGTTSWHDLALHIIARHVSPGEALRIAKVYLLKWHDEGELPYTALLRPLPHGDAVVRKTEEWLKEHFRRIDAIGRAVAHAGIHPEAPLQGRHRRHADRLPAEPAHRTEQTAAGKQRHASGRNQRAGGLFRHLLLPAAVQAPGRPDPGGLPADVRRREPSGESSATG
jgi:transcriptional regulator GlxA family with amidase domain